MNNHSIYVPEHHFRDFKKHPEDYSVTLVPVSQRVPPLMLSTLRALITLRHSYSGLSLTAPLSGWPDQFELARIMDSLWDQFCNNYRVREANARWLEKSNAAASFLIDNAPREGWAASTLKPRQPEGQGDLSGAPPQPDAEQGSG